MQPTIWHFISFWSQNWPFLQDRAGGQASWWTQYKHYKTFFTDKCEMKTCNSTITSHCFPSGNSVTDILGCFWPWWKFVSGVTSLNCLPSVDRRIQLGAALRAAAVVGFYTVVSAGRPALTISCLGLLVTKMKSRQGWTFFKPWANINSEKWVQMS